MKIRKIICCAILLVTALPVFAQGPAARSEHPVTACAPGTYKDEYSRGVESFQKKDYVCARLHWGRASQANVRATYNNLGYLLYFGLGGAVEPERAVSLWTVAARNGDRESQWHLALAFEEGKGVRRDLLTAYAWYRCADANFSAAPLLDQEDAQAAQDAKASIARVIAKLPAEQVEQAEVLARTYIQAFPFSERWLVTGAQKLL